MLFSLQAKDLVGPIVSLFAAGLSGLFFYLNSQSNSRASNRSIYVDGQKFVLEICNHLMADPLLWYFYDDYKLHEDNAAAIGTPLFQGKLMAFAHLHLNMFEIIFNEIPPPATGSKRNPSNVWLDYFHDTLNRSHVVRDTLEETGSDRIWGSKLLDEYRRWKKLKEQELEAAATAASSTPMSSCPNTSTFSSVNPPITPFPPPSESSKENPPNS